MKIKLIVIYLILLFSIQGNILSCEEYQENIKKVKIFLISDTQTLKIKNQFNSYQEYCIYFYDIITQIVNENIYFVKIYRVNELAFHKTTLLFNVHMKINNKDIYFQVHGDLLSKPNERNISFNKVDKEFIYN